MRLKVFTKNVLAYFRQRFQTEEAKFYALNTELQLLRVGHINTNYADKEGTTTFSTATFGILALRITTLRITTLRIMTHTMSTPSIKDSIAPFSIKGIQHEHLVSYT
jgi:hypothetical protein